MTVGSVIAAHEAAGRHVDVDGLSTFVRETGDGEAVLCIHGVPVSGFLYRKVLAELAQRGYRGIAYDFAGLGLSARPPDFDYSWTGLGRHGAGVVDALGLGSFHLVVHDVGGPVGFEIAAHHGERVRSLTILNTMIEAHAFDRPWSMEPFAKPLLGPLWLASAVKPVFRRLMYLQGIHDASAVDVDELDAHLALLKRDDGGAAFLKIMRGFERTQAKTELYTRVVQDDRYPKRLLWGALDPALKLERYGRDAERIAGVQLHTVAAKHFLQEDQAAAVAEHTVINAKSA